MNTKMPGKKVIGAKQTLKAIKNETAVTVYVAEDADQKVIKPIVEACLHMNLTPVYISTMHELGKMCDIEVGAATACIVKEQ